MTELVLVRHGETAWNHDRRLQGQTDVELSERGREQARRLAARLAPERFVAAYASDLKRAWETATIALVAHDVPLVAEPALREVHLGDWQGRTIAELRESAPGELARVWGDPVDQAPRGGESRGQLRERVVAGILAIADRHPDGQVLVVGHGGALRAFAAWVVGADPRFDRRLDLDNCGLSRVGVDRGEPVLRRWNDVSHLDGLVDPATRDWRVV